MRTSPRRSIDSPGSCPASRSNVEFDPEFVLLKAIVPRQARADVGAPARASRTRGDAGARGGPSRALGGRTRRPLSAAQSAREKFWGAGVEMVRALATVPGEAATDRALDACSGPSGTEGPARRRRRNRAPRASRRRRASLAPFARRHPALGVQAEAIRASRRARRRGRPPRSRRTGSGRRATATSSPSRPSRASRYARPEGPAAAEAPRPSRRRRTAPAPPPVARARRILLLRFVPGAVVVRAAPRTPTSA